jgi:hypothetical protein
MIGDHADDLVAFSNVRVIRSTAPALYCEIGDKRLWLPRRHISGRLFRRGDRGSLLIRRWVARDRCLFDASGSPTVAVPSASLSRRRLASPLQVVRRERGPSLAN